MMKKKTIKKKKLPKIKTLINKLNKVFNTYIKKRDGKCILTGDKKGLQCSHYYDWKQCSNLRWDERNANAMANHKGNAVHFKHHHGRAPDYARWMYNNHSKSFMEKLYKDSLIKKEYTRKGLEKLIKYYQNKLEDL